MTTQDFEKAKQIMDAKRNLNELKSMINEAVNTPSSSLYRTIELKDFSSPLKSYTITLKSLCNMDAFHANVFTNITKEFLEIVDKYTEVLDDELSKI